MGNSVFEDESLQGLKTKMFGLFRPLENQKRNYICPRDWLCQEFPEELLYEGLKALLKLGPSNGFPRPKEGVPCTLDLLCFHGNGFQPHLPSE